MSEQQASYTGKGDSTARLSTLKQKIEEGKTQKARASANLETYTKQLDDIKAEVVALDVEPTVEALGAEVERLDAEILAKLDAVEALLRGGTE